MRDIPLKLLATRDEISWEDSAVSDSDQRREVWRGEFNSNELANFYETEVIRNYKNSGWQDDVSVDFGAGRFTLSTRSAYTKGVWKDSKLGDTWEFLVEDEDADTQEVIEAEIRRALEKAKEDFDTLLSAADEALADFDKAQEQDAKEVAAARLHEELVDMLEEAERVIRHAAQEAKGRVKEELIGGWIHHADKIQALVKKATT